MKNCKRLKR